MNSSLFSWFQLTLGLLGVVGLFLVFIGIIALIAIKKKKTAQGIKIEVKKINDSFKENKIKLLTAILNETELKSLAKKEKDNAKAKKKAEKDNANTEKPKRIFLLDFNGDLAASAVTALREQISTIIQAARPCDEVIVRLESPGGMVHSYGLASSQLARLKEHRLTLTICVDKIAASGGYMMACLADKIIAAPFAIIGSIGVIASMPNLNKLLHKNDIEYLEITAGEYKRTLTPLGEITEKKKAKFQEQIDEVHMLFKNHVQRYRPTLDIDTVATGEYWYGIQALDLQLIDELKTSDDYLLNLSQDYEIYHIFTPKKETLRDKLANSCNAIFSATIKNKIFKEEEKYPLFI